MTVAPVADSAHRLLESSFDCVTTGPSSALVGGNICTGDRCAGNDPMHSAHT